MRSDCVTIHVKYSFENYLIREIEVFILILYLDKSDF